MSRGTDRRTFSRVVAVLCLLVAALGVALHHLTTDWAPVLVGASFASACCLFVMPALLAAWRGRLLSVALGAVVVAGLVVAQYAPLLRPSPGADGPRLRVLAQNMEFGGADAPALVRAVRDWHVDVLLTVETTPESVGRLRAAGLAETLPHSELSDRPGAAGVTVWSRCPVSGPVRYEQFSLGVLSARVDCPGSSVTAVAAHPIAPLFDAERSAWEAEELRSVLAGLPGDRPVVVGGDFNATWDHVRFRSLREIGYTGSVDGGGDGYLPTWPTDRAIPPVLPIDHVLARGAAWIGETDTLDLAGTDHRGIYATVVTRGRG